MAAVGGTPGRQASEEDWSKTTIKEKAYDFAKTEAEKLVWKEATGKPYTVSCINPAMVFGPCLAKPHTKASPYVFRQALLGNKQPNLPYAVVDVRDVATAHVEAMLRPEANGKRFILDGDEPPLAVNEIIARCRQMFPQYLFDDAPGKQAFPATIMSLDNTRSKTVLGIKYIPLEKVIRDSVQAIVKNRFVSTRASSKL